LSELSKLLIVRNCPNFDQCGNRDNIRTQGTRHFTVNSCPYARETLALLNMQKTTKKAKETKEKENKMYFKNFIFFMTLKYKHK
jgi:hypothetical protein